jgi:hypothetical protein
MSEDNTNNKKNKELEPNNRERNLQEYSSTDKDMDAENQSKLDQTNKKEINNHIHDNSCGCGQ